MDKRKGGQDTPIGVRIKSKIQEEALNTPLSRNKAEELSACSTKG